jgi:hypothetical protein
MSRIGFPPIPSSSAAGTLSPSGDTSGTTDTKNINAALVANASVVLASGNWYLNGVTISASKVSLQGSGLGTIINVPNGDTGITISNPTELTLASMSFSLGTGSLAILVNGAADSHFHDLWFTGSAAAGGVQVNGDDATEQHWSDCMFRAVGGVAFNYVRTNATDTGGMYLDRIRCVAPPATATHGFQFNSSNAGGTAVNLFMDECVSDSYYGDAIYMFNVSNVRVSETWMGISGASAGADPLHISGANCYNHAYVGCYTVNGIAAGIDVVIDASAHDILITGHVFDGGAGNTALGLAAAAANIIIGTYKNWTGTLTDTPNAFPNLTAAQIIQPCVFYTNGGGAALGAVAFADTSNPSDPYKYFRNSAGVLQIVNGAFSSVLASLDDSGDLTLTGAIVAPYAQVTSALAINATVPSANGTVATVPPTSATIQTALGNLALGTAWHNTLSYDVWLTVYLAITVNTSLVVKDGVGTTTTPTQTTIITGTTALGIVPLRAKVQAGMYRLLSVSGTGTDAIVGQYLEAA